MSKEYKLFNLYYKNLKPNLNIVDIELVTKSFFVCPLCNNVFTEEDIEKKNITIEHVIPDELGGKIKTLTCKKCNNDYGSKYIEKLIQKFKVLKNLEKEKNISYDLFVNKRLI